MRKKLVLFVTQTRGFFNNLFATKFDSIEIRGKRKSYEVSSIKHKLLSKLVRSKLADWLGVIQRLKVNNIEDVDVIGSFNRFILTEHPYFIYLENQTAFYHYAINRNKTYLGNKKYVSFLKDENLKYIICMSKVCEDKVKENLVKNNVNKKTVNIYPLVPSNPYVTELKIRDRKKNKKLKLLFVVQGSRFISKGGLEVVEIMEKVSSLDIELTLITEIEYIPQSARELIQHLNSIELLNFGFSSEQMQQIYASHDLLLHLTSDDSSPLTVLEAMKSGLPVISTKLYAIPEMVKNDVNGYLYSPKWDFFNKYNDPNPDVWNHRKRTIYSLQLDTELINQVSSKLTELYHNRKKIEELALNSFEIANNAPFSAEFITTQWETLINSVIGEE